MRKLTRIVAAAIAAGSFAVIVASAPAASASPTAGPQTPCGGKCW